MRKIFDKNKNTKAQLGKLAEIILILAGGIIIYLFTASVVEKSTYNEVISACRFSVLSQSSTEFVPGVTGQKSLFNINCEKRYVNFYNTRVELGLSPTNMKPRPINIEGKQMNKFKELTDFTVNQVLAEELRICKYQFLDGQKDVFVNDEGLFINKKICFVCTEITFDPGVRKKTFDNLLEYTNRTTFDDTRVTYYDYLTQKSLSGNTMWLQPGYKTEGFNVDVINKAFDFDNADKDYGNLTIDTSKKYVIFFEKYQPSQIKEIESNEQYWVAIVPLMDINNYCNLQAS